MRNTKTLVDQGLINHVVFVLDNSASMNEFRDTVKQVFKAQIAALAKLSEEENQETRISVYRFGLCGNCTCLIYDKDVLRLPNIDQHYTANEGSTALREATKIAIEELEKTATLYGDHAFLMYVLTDGLDNASNRVGATNDVLKNLISRKMREDWAIAALIPKGQASRYGPEYKQATIECGFDASNIQEWDVSTAGLEEVSKVVTASASNYFKSRSLGQKITRGVFDLSTEGVKKAVVAGVLEPVKERAYAVIKLTDPSRKYRIDETVQENLGVPYAAGKGFYQLHKREEIQYNKDIAIRHKDTLQVYRGPAAREMVGLPIGITAKFSPVDSPEYDVFVQSTSFNRRLHTGYDMLYFK